MTPDFAATFREHVVPDLRRMIPGYGELVAWNWMAFGDACDAVMTEARRRGAGRLAAAEQLRLDHWISVSMLHAMQRHATAVLRHECAIRDMHVAGWIMQGVGAI